MRGEAGTSMRSKFSQIMASSPLSCDTHWPHFFTHYFAHVTKRAISSSRSKIRPKCPRMLNYRCRAKRLWAISNLILFRHVFLACRLRRALPRKAHDTTRSRITSLQDPEGSKTKVAKSSLPTALPGAEQQ